MEKYVGTDDQVNNIMSLMNIDAKDKRIIVIIDGKGGIGKTTLAKLIYNQVSCDFDGCSFLTDIRETTLVLGGPQLLQAKLISDVLKRELEDVPFVNRGIEFLRDLFCNMRILIVLDDVENAFHVQQLVGNCFNCFASGSRILVTTRNSVILEESPQIRTYHVNLLDKDQARQLFRQHASIATSSSRGNIRFLPHAFEAIGALPLYIEVMSAVFNRKTEEERTHILRRGWTIDKHWYFREFLEEGYRTLNDGEKQIFLDIACFTTGIDFRIARYLWYDTSFLPSRKILTSLAKIGENNQIWMHSLLRRLGREIVRAESLTNPERRSRLFNHEIALDTIKKKKMKNLRVLDLTGCADLLVTPKFSGCQNLAILILERCSQLVKIDRSISDLKCLVSLNLKFCTELSMLPIEVGRLTALQELLINGTSVQEIPISIGHLKQLETLSASSCFTLSLLPRTICHLTNISLLSLDGTRIATLPDSVGELVRLKHLSLRDCRRIRKLPSSIGSIGRSLVELDVSGTGISKFPDSLKNLQNLKVLRMDSCFFREFPPNIGELTSLEEIHASWCRSLEGGIPSKIGKLHNLRILRLRHSTISSIPTDIHQLSNLRTLDILHCDMIRELPRLPSSITVLYVDDELKSSHLP
ncbi:hypothetical protein EUGRSUZ_E03330 [Eucalyptus grandis]|uniref:Uncharacterized protein n=2 Tax=Eucalyptus grandis TaxID=71139 RepID=A0ACC3KZ50_EUCGR|nr:hypothetical protein EUGRSUZ_E03330 [Eucalyptus grandis]